MASMARRMFLLKDRAELPPLQRDHIMPWRCSEAEALYLLMEYAMEAPSFSLGIPTGWSSPCNSRRISLRHCRGKASPVRRLCWVTDGSSQTRSLAARNISVCASRRTLDYKPLNVWDLIRDMVCKNDEMSLSLSPHSSFPSHFTTLRVRGRESHSHARARHRGQQILSFMGQNTPERKNYIMENPVMVE